MWEWASGLNPKGPYRSGRYVPMSAEEEAEQLQQRRELASRGIQVLGRM